MRIISNINEIGFFANHDGFCAAGGAKYVGSVGRLIVGFGELVTEVVGCAVVDMLLLELDND